MALNTKRNNSRNDMVITIVALTVLIFAGGISIATINTDHKKSYLNDSILEPLDPFDKAEQAAIAGIKAAQGHINCHGIKESGGLPERFYANGGRFKVSWDDINIEDSTVHIVSTGYFETNDENTYTSHLESEIKVELAVTHNQKILSEYYKNHSNILTKQQLSDK